MKLPIVFDTDCISSFLWIKRLDIINALFPNQIIIPQSVYDELNKIRSPQYRFLFNDLYTQILQENFELKNIMVTSWEFNEYRKLISCKRQDLTLKLSKAILTLKLFGNGKLKCTFKEKQFFTIV